jgi:hypothetical protein
VWEFLLSTVILSVLGIKDGIVPEIPRARKFFSASYDILAYNNYL